MEKLTDSEYEEVMDLLKEWSEEEEEEEEDYCDEAERVCMYKTQWGWM